MSSFAIENYTDIKSPGCNRGFSSTFILERLTFGASLRIFFCHKITPGEMVAQMDIAYGVCFCTAGRIYYQHILPADTVHRIK